MTTFPQSTNSIVVSVFLLTIGIGLAIYSQDRFSCAFFANLVSLASLTMICIGCDLIFSRKFSYRKSASASIYAAGIIAFLLWINFGTYESIGVRTDTGILLCDTKSRSSGQVVYREAWGDGWIYKGGFSESQKQHGKWHFFQYEPSPSITEDEFYWFGEKINEGEWNLRNR